MVIIVIVYFINNSINKMNTKLDETNNSIVKERREVNLDIDDEREEYS